MKYKMITFIKSLFASLGLTLFMVFILLFTVMIGGVDSLTDNMITPIFIYLPIGIFVTLLVFFWYSFKN